MKLLYYLFFLLIPFTIHAQNLPKNGWLLLLGGGITKQHAELVQRFAGGDSAKVIVIPTALSDKELDRDSDFKKIHQRFTKLGLPNTEIFHSRDKFLSNDEHFCHALKNTNAVFFLGGNTQRIADAYLGTLAQEELIRLLERGGIIAGVSAGSGIQTAYFDRNGLQKGFEFIKGMVVMNHFLSRNKQFDHVEDLKNNPGYLGIGIDDNTGILVQGNQFEVIGKSYVAIYDGKNYARSNDSISVLPENSERFYLLQNGDRYDLSKREVISNKRLEPAPLSVKELREYTGDFKAVNKNFGIEFIMKEGTLTVKNSWGWIPYPVYPFEKDTFFAVNRNMWFQFVRDAKSGKIVGVKKMKSVLQQKVITDLKKIN